MICVAVIALHVGDAGMGMVGAFAASGAAMAVLALHVGGVVMAAGPTVAPPWLWCPAVGDGSA